MSVPYDETVLTANGPGVADTGLASSDATGAGEGSAAPGAKARPSGFGNPAVRAAMGAAFISSSAIVVTLAHTGAATAAFYRCALALPVLIPLALVERRRRGPRPLRARLFAILAGLFLAGDLVMWNHSIPDVGAGVATVLGNLQVLFIAVLAWLVLKERPNGRYLTLLPVILAGVILVSGVVGGSTTGVNPVAGTWLGLGTSLAYAVFLLILRQTAGQTRHVAGQLADATFGAAVGALLLGLTLGSFQFRVPWPSFGWLVMLALVSQTVGWLFITSSLPQLPAAVSSLVLLLQPAASMVLAYFILGQRPTVLQILGGVLVCVGVLAVTWTRRARSRPAPAEQTQSQPVQPEQVLPQAVTANST
jgi:drug/metabolite transporter (DMT)-like permease